LSYTVNSSASSVDLREIAVIPEYIELCPKCMRLLVTCSDPDKHCSACGYCGQESIYYVKMLGKLPE